MLDRARQRAAAAAKSRRATPEELREAGKRMKEIEQELLQRGLSDEAKHGEVREKRYRRVLRLRAMRDDFQAGRPLEARPHVNSLLLAVGMTVASFLLCAFCAGGAFFSVQLLQQKPDPMAVASAFWDDMEHSSYSDLRSNYLSSTLRVQYSESEFISQATKADTEFGHVSDAVLTKKSGDLTQTAVLSYYITRSHAKYNTTITLTLRNGSWGVDDLGATIDPTQAGVPEPPTPTPTLPPSSPPSGAPTNTPTGNRGAAPFA